MTDTGSVSRRRTPGGRGSPRYGPVPLREGEAPAEPHPLWSKETLMTEGKKLPERKKPASGVLIPPDCRAIVLVAVCTRNRERWLAADDVHGLLVRIWKEATAWRALRYVLMPDHLHLFAAYAGSDISFDAWVQHWKSVFTKEHGVPAHRWQSKGWDHRLRSGESYAAKWEYVRNNPVRHGLAKSPEEWPYQGEIDDLSW
jgi:putative transposase